MRGPHVPLGLSTLRRLLPPARSCLVSMGISTSRSEGGWQGRLEGRAPRAGGGEASFSAPRGPARGSSLGCWGGVPVTASRTGPVTRATFGGRVWPGPALEIGAVGCLPAVPWSLCLAQSWTGDAGWLQGPAPPSCRAGQKWHRTSPGVTPHGLGRSGKCVGPMWGLSREQCERGQPIIWVPGDAKIEI